MSSFTDPLIVEVEQGEIQGRGTVKLTRPFDYDIGALGSGETVSVPAGFLTDLASVPWFARMFFAPFDRAAKAAVVHDYLLSIRDRPKPSIDRIFLEAMTVLRVGWLRRTLMYLAVRTRR